LGVLPASPDTLRFCFEELLEQLHTGGHPVAVLQTPCVEQLNRIAESLGFPKLIVMERLRRGQKDASGVTWEFADEKTYEATAVNIIDPLSDGKAQRIFLGAGARYRSANGQSFCAQEVNPDAGRGIAALLGRWVKYLQPFSNNASATTPISSAEKPTNSAAPGPLPPAESGQGNGAELGDAATGFDPGRSGPGQEFAAEPGEAPPPAPADPEAYRPAKEFLEPGRFDNYKAIRNALKLHPWIRSRKPSKQRLEIHAGDWQRMRNVSPAGDLMDQPAATVDAVMAVEQRKAAERARKFGQ
jgi:hypothetical protein